MKLHFHFLFSVGLLISAQAVTTDVFSQDVKRIASINSNEILSLLPETRKADSSLKVLHQVLTITGEDYENEFNERLEKFNRDSSKMTVVIKESERKKLLDLYNRSQYFQEEAEQTLENRKRELFTPLEEKVRNTIRDVAKESGYSYVLESQLFHVAPIAVDITEPVKKKLAIK